MTITPDVALSTILILLGIGGAVWKLGGQNAVAISNIKSLFKLRAEDKEAQEKKDRELKESNEAAIALLRKQHDEDIEEILEVHRQGMASIFDSFHRAVADIKGEIKCTNDNLKEVRQEVGQIRERITTVETVVRMRKTERVPAGTSKEG